MSGRLAGKVALITGTGKGMGRAAALLFAKEGAKVVVCDINEANGNAVVAEIKKAGGEATFIRTDASSVSDLEKLVKATVAKYGKLNIFWHNAGNAGPGRIEDTSEKDFDVTIGIHDKGGYFGCKFAIPEIKRAGGGSILFTASASGIKPSNISPAYSMAKASLIMLTKSLALYLAKDNIRVNSIAAGVATTGLTADFAARDPNHTAEERAKMWQQKIPMGRIGETEDIANAGLFLVSDDAKYITGVVLPVDGGISAM